MNVITIPEGDFSMGYTLDPKRIKTRIVYVSEFEMDAELVSWGVWKAIGGTAGRGKADDHPVHSIRWVDAVLWCNLRSVHDGLDEAYRVGEGYSVSCDWEANGWRLPTEAEYEKACRGGLVNQAFPWGSTISEAQANYQGQTYFPYDKGPSGYNAKYKTLPQPYTNPINAFKPNLYGMRDPVGNLNSWCWDFFDKTNTSHSIRGGCWGNYAASLSCGNRGGMHNAGWTTGLRCVRRETK